MKVGDLVKYDQDMLSPHKNTYYESLVGIVLNLSHSLCGWDITVIWNDGHIDNDMQPLELEVLNESR